MSPIFNKNNSTEWDRSEIAIFHLISHSSVGITMCPLLKAHRCSFYQEVWVNIYMWLVWMSVVLYVGSAHYSSSPDCKDLHEMHYELLCNMFQFPQFVKTCSSFNVFQRESLQVNSQVNQVAAGRAQMIDIVDSEDTLYINESTGHLSVHDVQGFPHIVKVLFCWIFVEVKTILAEIIGADEYRN